MLFLLLACATSDDSSTSTTEPHTAIHDLACTGNLETVTVRANSVVIYQLSEPINDGWDVVTTRMDYDRSTDGQTVQVTCEEGASGKILEVW